VSTQLRLVETPDTGTKKQAPKPKRAAKRPKTTVAPASRGSRRAVNWGEWHLDARTHTVGRAGVARARQALEAAAASEELSRAS
jgi:hypothetical protein